MLEPIMARVDGKEVLLTCRHAASWPPAWARLGEPPEALRRRGYLDDTQLGQARTWQQVCGLLRMDAGKCATCPLALGPQGQPVVPDTRLRVRLEKPKRGRVARVPR